MAITSLVWDESRIEELAEQIHDTVFQFLDSFDLPDDTAGEVAAHIEGMARKYLQEKFS